MSIRAGHLRAGLKALIDLISIVAMLPLAAMYRAHLGIPGTNPDTVIQGYSQFIALLPTRVGTALRRAFLRLTVLHCDRATHVGFGTLFATPAVALHDGVYVGSFCNLGHVTIERDTLIGSNVTVLSGKNQHHVDRIDVPIRHQGGTNVRVHIGRDVWIGNGAIIMADIADHAVIAAGAVVVKPVPAFAIVAGNPARIVGTREADTRVGSRSESARPEIVPSET